MRKFSFCTYYYSVLIDDTKTTLTINNSCRKEQIIDSLKTYMNIEFIDRLEKDKFTIGDEIISKNNLIYYQGSSSVILVNKETRLVITYDDYNFYDKTSNYTLSDDNPIKNYLLVYNYVDEFVEKFKEKKVDKVNVLYMLNLYDCNNMTKIISGNNIFLALPNFYKKNNHWMNLHIIDNKTYENVGCIEFVLKKHREDNFSYGGNVSYYIKEKYRNKGYATEALKLLKDYILQIKEDVNKDIFVSVALDNEASIKVIENNNATMLYEGMVPEDKKYKVKDKSKKLRVYKLN